MAVDPQPFTWTVRPSNEHPEKMAVIGLVSLCAGLLTFIVLHSFILSLLGFAIIVGATMDFWLPTRYVLDESGATAKCGFSVSTILWEQVKSLEIEKLGIVLSPLPAPSRMSMFRGVLLKFGALHADEVSEAILRLGGEHVRSLG